jgi:hypothetical protein
MNLDELYKEHYFFEINRKHELTKELNIPIGVLTILGGAIIYFFNEIPRIVGLARFVLVIFLIASLVFFLLTIYFLIRSYYGYTYRYLPTSEELRDYRERLEQYYQTESHNLAGIDAEMESYIRAAYARCAHKNTINNDSKSGYLYKANGFLILTLICGLLCTVPYLWAKTNQPERVEKVNVVNFPILSEEMENTMSPESQKKLPPKEPPKPQNPPQKPQPPKDRLIREDKQPQEKR